MKSVVVAIAVVALSLLASVHRFGDSAHAMGLLSRDGGTARHPVRLSAGRARYAIVVTATVLPGFRGDVGIRLVGVPRLPYRLAATAAVIDLGLRRHPVFHDSTFVDVQPGDRLALWVVIRPDNEEAAGPYALQFHDPDSGRSLLTVPILFAAAGEDHHGK